MLARSEFLRAIKEKQPETTILAFNVLMRITRGNDAEEEKAYWADWGVGFSHLHLEDRANMAVSAPEEAEELAALRAEVPQHVLDDYLAGRAQRCGQPPHDRVDGSRGPRLPDRAPRTPWIMAGTSPKPANCASWCAAWGWPTGSRSTRHRPDRHALAGARRGAAGGAAAPRLAALQPRAPARSSLPTRTGR